MSHHNAQFSGIPLLLTRFKRKLAVAKRSRHRKATVAVACKLTVVMHAMWVDGTFYCGDPLSQAVPNNAAYGEQPPSSII
jgi:transposase